MAWSRLLFFLRDLLTKGLRGTNGCLALWSLLQLHHFGNTRVLFMIFFSTDANDACLLAQNLQRKSSWNFHATCPHLLQLERRLGSSTQCATLLHPDPGTKISWLPHFVRVMSWLLSSPCTTCLRTQTNRWYSRRDSRYLRMMTLVSYCCSSGTLIITSSFIPNSCYWLHNLF